MTPSYVDLFVKAGRVKQIAITWWIFPFPIESSLIALKCFEYLWTGRVCISKLRTPQIFPEVEHDPWKFLGIFVPRHLPQIGPPLRLHATMESIAGVKRDFATRAKAPGAPASKMRD